MTSAVVSWHAAVITVGKRRHKSHGRPPRLEQHERLACAFQISQGFSFFSRLISKHLSLLLSVIQFFSLFFRCEPHQLALLIIQSDLLNG